MEIKKLKENRFKYYLKVAQEIAEEDYHITMRNINCDNPEYLREWVEYKIEGSVWYGLKGTPDKAFVIVEPNKKQITAMRQDKSIICKFENVDCRVI